MAGAKRKLYYGRHHRMVFFFLVMQAAAMSFLIMCQMYACAERGRCVVESEPHDYERRCREPYKLVNRRQKKNIIFKFIVMEFRSEHNWPIILLAGWVWMAKRDRTMIYTSGGARQIVKSAEATEINNKSSMQTVGVIYILMFGRYIKWMKWFQIFVWLKAYLKRWKTLTRLLYSCLHFSLAFSAIANL